ncbi:MAG: hypothetical protein R3Y58_08700 [Eubacteriales bacterium]
MSDITLNTSVYPMDSEVVTTTDSDGNVTVSYDRAIDSAILRKLYSNLYTDGISPNNSSCLQVTSGEGMTVNVASGFCILAGALKVEETMRNLTVQASNALYDRIDMVVMRLNDNREVRDADLYILEGTAASTPAAPALTRSESIYEIGLATLFISKNTTTISQERITDLRYNTDYCGVITSPSEFDTDFIYTQVQAALTAFENESAAEFETWFQTIQDQLAGDVAANLQGQIDALNEPEFAETESLGDDEIENISSGESIFSIFAKLRKWFFQIVTNKTGIASLVTSLSSLTTTVSGKAPTSHASTGTGYGLGNASNYGHVKVSDNYTASAGAASAGVAASSQAVYNAYATAASKSTVPTSHASAATTYGVGNASNYGHVALDDNVSANAASSGHAATPVMVYKEAISCIECTKAAMQADTAYAHPIVYNVSGVSAAQYRIDFGAVSTFLNYPTGKTILATIPIGMHNETDTSFVHPIGISSNNGNVWGAAQKNTAYTARVLVIYRTYV